jgi:hypothetical protein
MAATQTQKGTFAVKVRPTCAALRGLRAARCMPVWAQRRCRRFAAALERCVACVAFGLWKKHQTFHCIGYGGGSGEPAASLRF